MPVQRDIGFEFEANGFRLWEANNPAHVPNGPFASQAAVSHVNTNANRKRIPKGATVLSHPAGHYELQADDQGASASDPEIVTTHFTEDPAGRANLDTALVSMKNVNNAIKAEDPKGGAPAPAIAAGMNVSRPAAFITPWAKPLNVGMVSAPQVTMGLDLANVSTIVSDLHGAPGETAPEKGQRNPGRMAMRRARPNNANKPLKLTPGHEQNTLVLGATLANQALQGYQATHPAAPGGSQLLGMLTLIFTYREGVQYKGSFLKSHTPLMAKTDFATMWTTLPLPVQQWYGKRKSLFGGKVRFEDLVGSAPGYAARLDQPLMNTTTVLADEVGINEPEWYKALSLRSWVRGMTANVDPTLSFRGTLGRVFRGDRGVDRLTTAAFPGLPPGKIVEGYGVLGHRMDPKPVAVGPGSNPVMELRSPTKMMTVDEFEPWAQKMFDYIVSVNSGARAPIT